MPLGRPLSHLMRAWLLAYNGVTVRIQLIAGFLAALFVSATLGACGGMSSGLTTSGALDHPYGSRIAAADPVTIIFHRQLDSATIPGNITVTEDGFAAPFTVSLSESGYTLTIVPSASWKPGAVLAIALAGGVDGLRYTDGRTFSTINLVYYVEQQ
jgi:hypothetical protein